MSACGGKFIFFIRSQLIVVGAYGAESTIRGGGFLSAFVLPLLVHDLSCSLLFIKRYPLFGVCRSGSCLQRFCTITSFNYEYE